MTGVEVLYKNFGILADAGEDAVTHTEVYQSFLDATKATLPEKKLACQFIPRFFKHFPSLAESAIDAQLDLCEDEETPLRCMAIKSLPDFCKHSVDHIPRITDILTQLLQQEDAAEVAIVHTGLEMLIEKDPHAALGAIFSQIIMGDELVREKAIAFLSQVVTIGKVFKDETAGQFLLQEVQKVLSDVTGEEFTIFISILTKVKSISGNPQILADLITEQAELDKPFQPAEPESLDRLITCTQQAAPFFIKGASPAKYMEYLFKNVLPVIGEIFFSESGDYKYGVLKLIAELSAYATTENAHDYFETVYKKLIEYMPLPSQLTGDEKEEEAISKLNFSFVECLIYSLHKLGSKSETYLTAGSNGAILKEFHQRLTYFGRMTQAYIKQLKTALQGKDSVALEANAENKLKVVALLTCSNITMIIKDLLHNPPSFKSSPVVSWKSKSTPITKSGESVEEKRKRAGITPISVDDLPPKKERGNNTKSQLYSLPSQRKGVKMDDEFMGRSSGGFSGRYRGGNRGRGRAGFQGGGKSRNQENYENFLMR